MVSYSKPDIYPLGIFITQSTQSTHSFCYTCVTLLIVIYTSSLLALINSRDYIRAGGLDHENYAVSLETQPKSHGGVGSSVLTSWLVT